MNVLLLEPYTGMRVMVRGVLSAMGIDKLLEPKTSIEAMHILLHDRIDFFICSDMVKPIEALMCIKLIRNAREENIRHTRIIVSVDQYGDDEIKKLEKAGCDFILRKPFSADDITSHISNLIQHRPGFIECKAYVGPDRRRWQTPLKHDERRDETFNPGRAEFRHSLRKLIQRLFDLQAQKQKDRDQKREDELKARGILMETTGIEAFEANVDELKDGMLLQAPINSLSGMLVLPAGHTLGPKSISRLKDLVLAERISDSFTVAIIEAK